MTPLTTYHGDRCEPVDFALPTWAEALAFLAFVAALGFVLAVFA